MPPTDSRSHKLVCADYSREAREELFGTAKRVDLWLLIEYRGRWEPDAWAVLPEAARELCRRLGARYPRMRVALIGQPHRTSGPLAVVIAESRETHSRLHEFAVDGYEDLWRFDLPVSAPASPVEPLFAVCTHGTHDLCCARYGNPIYRALRRVEGERVWQVSHVGGCRFAPNVVCLPEGVVYGRLAEEDCAAMASASREGCLLLPRLRGRSCYDKPVQAAEYLLRTLKGIRRIDDLSVTDAAMLGDGRWSIGFRSATAECYRLVLAAETAPAGTYRNCGAEQESARQRFRLDSCVTGGSEIAHEGMPTEGERKYGMRSDSTETGRTAGNAEGDAAGPAATRAVSG